MQDDASILMGVDESGSRSWAAAKYSCRPCVAVYYQRFLALYYPLWLVLVTVVMSVYFKKSTHPSPVIVIFPATTFVAPLFFAALFCSLGRKPTQPRSSEMASHHMHQTAVAPRPSQGMILDMSLAWRVYNRNELAAATQNFDDTNVLGAGGEATVFKGIEATTTGSSRAIAVKRYYHNTSDLDELERANLQFKREVKALTRACHPNVVCFYGYCIHGHERYLVYELMPNGSLYDWLFASKHQGTPLAWDRRLTIAQGAARGLDYLHNDSTVNLIHLDMKPENILLDENLNAKVADFGLSKLIPRDQTRLPGSSLVGGTPGYLPPEFSMIGDGGENTITKKADVYSFGIVLLQLVSGRTVNDVATMPPNEAASPLPGLTFRDAAFYLVMTQQTHRLLDASLAAAANLSAVGMKMAEISATCIEINPEDRPDMRHVRIMLEKIEMSIDGQYSERTVDL